MRREWLRLGGVLVVVLLGLGLFREYRLRKEVEIRTENQYQRAFQEVVYHLDGLEQELGKAAAAGSMTQIAKAFADAWRHSESARASIGQLPIANVPLSSTESFLARVAAFTYTVSQRGPSGAALTDREWSILRDLHKQARFAADELARMGRAFTAGALRWTDVQRDVAAAATRPERTPRATPSSQVTKSFKMLEDGMTRFPSPDIEGVIPPPRQKIPAIPGPEIGTDEAVRIALDFIGPEVLAGRSARVISRVPSEPEAYRIEVPPARGRNNRILMDVSVRGGRVLWMMDESPIGSATITPSTAEPIAAEFLESRGFARMRRVSRQAYQGVA
ncbi:MAG: PepSY1/2 domain-containing protein, partial [Bacillota bacterium]